MAQLRKLHTELLQNLSECTEQFDEFQKQPLSTEVKTQLTSDWEEVTVSPEPVHASHAGNCSPEPTQEVNSSKTKTKAAHRSKDRMTPLQTCFTRCFLSITQISHPYHPDITSVSLDYIGIILGIIQRVMEANYSRFLENFETARNLFELTL